MRVTPTSAELCRAAIGHLKAARDQLTEAGAKRAADKVRNTINSAEGALRHAENKRTRQETADHGA